MSAAYTEWVGANIAWPHVVEGMADHPKMFGGRISESRKRGEMGQAQRQRCVIVGDESLAVACAERWRERGHLIDAILSTSAEVRDWAEANGIPTFRESSELVTAVSSGSVDYLFSIANLKILADDVLSLPTSLAVNFHDGPLPMYAGLNTPVWAILHDERTYGITWHVMERQVDAGDVVEREAFSIAPDETALSLNTKCYEAGVRAFDRLIKSVERGSLNRTPLTKGATDRYFGRSDRPSRAGVIDWSCSHNEIQQLVRALHFGNYVNPMCEPKLELPSGEVFAVRGTIPDSRPRGEAQLGEIVGFSDALLEVAAQDGTVGIDRLVTLDGSPVSPSELTGKVRVGDILVSPTGPTVIQLERAQEASAKSETYWVQRLGELVDYDGVFDVSTIDSDAPQLVTIDQGVEAWSAAIACLGSQGARAEAGAGLVCAFLARVADQVEFDVMVDAACIRSKNADISPYFTAARPLRVSVDPALPISALVNGFRESFQAVVARGTIACDIIGRYPELHDCLPFSDLAVGIAVGSDTPPTQLLGKKVTVVINETGDQCTWIVDPRVISVTDAEALRDRFETFLRGLTKEASLPVGQLPVLSEQDITLIASLNDTTVPTGPIELVHAMIEHQARETPSASAVSFGAETVSYEEFLERVCALADGLRAHGVGARDLVGVCLPRSIEMLVSVVAVLRLGAAYVPMDPDYPGPRLDMMLEDAKPVAVLVNADSPSPIIQSGSTIIRVDQPIKGSDLPPADRTAKAGITGADLAYVIFTSGSTGRPKGVMVEHRNVVNFFRGMDDVVPHANPGVWLAVTSLSFDISVLELLWTLSKGFHVVIAPDRANALDQTKAHQARPLEFSLFYFAADESTDASDKYRLLLDGAKFADEHGFAAVWTPERHFHSFGGLYPNPSVVSAAIAATTKRIGIRAGSCVLPLHHPARVAEEWAVVDNLSGGRVGISFASGWQPNDFVLQPNNYAHAKTMMFEATETVRKLWRGESVSFPGPKGDVAVRTLPRPVQPELPVWITTAGNPETAAQAGKVGANLLTHLLGQDIEEVASKIAVYRGAWQQAGHSGRGHVTLMIHAFVGDDRERVRNTVRGPLKSYLGTATNLLKQYASTFPAFKQLGEGAEAMDFGSLAEEDLEALLDHSFERYFETSGLFGTPSDCAEIIDRIKGADVDELACLIDFGIATDTVLTHLPFLDALRASAQPPQEGMADDGIGALLRQHDITHLQCTPSMAKMLLGDPESRDELSRLSTMLVGGEALDGQVAVELASRVGVPVVNMYGPTETTVWSTTHSTAGETGTVPIGRPIANTKVFVVDRRGQWLPPGSPGELWIGGLGVTRGYLGRDDLTAERFVDMHDGAGQHRVYRTGDLVRLTSQGVLEFLGRSDEQVKVRGHRIELGDIEAVLRAHADVADVTCVVPVGADAERLGLVAWVIPVARGSMDVGGLRDHAVDQLPEFMVPSHYVTLDAFPMTPNGKIDRSALMRTVPKPIARAREDLVGPRNDVEKALTDIWCTVLGASRLGIHDDFFALGGNSLSTIHITFRVREAFGVELPLRVVFAAPTIARMAEEITGRLASSDSDIAVDRLVEELQGMTAAEAAALVADLITDPAQDSQSG